MKIAVIEPSGRLYGSEFCLLDIIDGLPRDRFDWQVFLPEGGGLDSLLLDRGIKCEFLIPRSLNLLPRSRKFSAYFKLLWKLGTSKPDLLYVNQTGILRVAAVVSRLLNLPLICQVQMVQDAQWLSRNQNLHFLVQNFICNSRYVADNTNCEEIKKSILYQGISPIRLERAKKKQRETQSNYQSGVESKNSFTIGIIGRITSTKGHYLLLEAAQKLSLQFSGCRFVVIGEGIAPEDTVKFKEAVASNELAPKFEFRGYRQDLTTELARLDLVAIPSLEEALGRVLFDAAEHGVPAVVSDACGLGELSRRFDVGIRFRSGDADSLAKAILQVKDNYDRTRSDFLCSAVKMFESLSMKSYLSRYEEILTSAANNDAFPVVWLGDD